MLLFIPKMLCPELRKLSKKQAHMVWKTVMRKYEMRSTFFMLLVFAFLTLIIIFPWFGFDPILSSSGSDTRLYICSISVSIIAVTSTFLFFRGRWRDEVAMQIKKLEGMVQDDNPTEISEVSNEQSGLHST